MLERQRSFCLQLPVPLRKLRFSQMGQLQRHLNSLRMNSSVSEFSIGLIISGILQRFGGVAHGDSDTCFLDNGYVVASVSKSHRFFWFDAMTGNDCRNPHTDGLQYFRSINHKIYILTQIPEIIPPNLLHRGHNLTCDRLLMLPGTITGPIVIQQ